MLMATTTAHAVVNEGLVFRETRFGREHWNHGELADSIVRQGSVLEEPPMGNIMDLFEWKEYSKEFEGAQSSTWRLVIEEKFFSSILYLEVVPSPGSSDWHIRRGFAVVRMNCEQGSSWYRLVTGTAGDLRFENGRIGWGFIKASFEGIAGNFTGKTELNVDGDLGPVCRLPSILLKGKGGTY